VVRSSNTMIIQKVARSLHELHGVVLLVNHIHVRLMWSQIQLSFFQQLITLMEQFTIEVFAREPVFQNLDCSVKYIAFMIFSYFHHIENFANSFQVTANGQQLLIRCFIIFPILSSLHLLDTSSKSNVRIMVPTSIFLLSTNRNVGYCSSQYSLFLLPVLKTTINEFSFPL
jgi:hypothetical protein